MTDQPETGPAARPDPDILSVPHPNPVDPGLSAAPGAEKRSLAIPFSIVGALILAALILWIATPHGPRPPVLVFQNPDLGCRFEYPSVMIAGPNFIKAPSGSLLTIERHSLDMAKKDWVAGLPDVLFPQVKIQLDENYIDIQELSRTPVTIDGRKALEVVLKGHSNAARTPTVITIAIVATDDWVYVLRTYSGEKRDAAERPLFRRIRETWKFLGAPGRTETAPGTGAGSTS